MTILAALAAALCNALNVVTQHIASTAPHRPRGWRFVLYLFRSPMWLFGWIFLAGSFVFQALALHKGELSVVQPLLVTELVFSLVLRRLWLRQQIRGITWAAAGLTSVGLAVFLLAAEPQGGHSGATAGAWWSATLVAGATAAALTLLARRGDPLRRAAMLGSAAAITWALVATFIKATTDTFVSYGVAGMFTHWPIYALAVAGLVGEVLDQAALHVGPLSYSQPFLVIVDPMVSIGLAVWIFGEYFTARAWVLALAILAFAGMCVGIVILTRTAPATMEPSRST
jgi:drug/metabolite transporter (DMT)-like permease